MAGSTSKGRPVKMSRAEKNQCIGGYERYIQTAADWLDLFISKNVCIIFFYKKRFVYDLNYFIVIKKNDYT